MFNGWFCFGGTEIINNTRAIDYARSADCPVNWFVGPRCEGTNDALDHPVYNMANIQDAPWYDPDEPFLSAQFLGVYCLTVDGLEDETLEASVIERVTSGGVIGRQRDASRSVRFRVVLTATTENGLEYGRSWLASVLRENLCGMHDGSCGTSDLRFWTRCQPPWTNAGGPISGYYDDVDRSTRILHGVKTTTSLLKEQELRRPGVYGAVFEFTLTAEKPRLLGLPYWLNQSASGEFVVQDAPFNLMPTPSAELAGPAVIVAENLSPNPSLETNATGWGRVAGTGILDANLVGTRVTGELAAVGTASYRTVFTATNTGTNGYFGNQPPVTMIPTGKHARVSISLWAAAVVMAGTPSLKPLEFYAFWMDGATILGHTGLGTVPAAGGAVSHRSLVPLAGADRVQLEARLALNSWASGNVIRFYTDAVAVTVP